MRTMITQSNHRRSLSRRRFLIASTATTLTAASWSRAAGANSRIGVALVGCGIRGHEVMSRVLATNRAELRCICDIYDEHRRLAREELVAGQSPFETAAIEEVLAHPGVDAVLLAVPDHLHVTLGVMVLKANKHLYLEKPIAHHPDEHAALIEAAKDRHVVLQCGMQQRSGAHYRQAKEEIVDKGKLGQVLFVRGVWHDFPRQRRPFKSRPKPAGLDWDRFLGPAPKRPFDWMRYDSWRLFPDYGGGQLSDILTHWVDVAQWFMNETRPVDAVATGGIYRLNDGRENPDTVSAILRYARNWNFNFECTLLPIPGVKPHVAFYGTEGTLEISRTNYLFRAARKHAIEVKVEENLDGAHAANWLDAIAGSAPVNADLAAGLSACDAVHLARAAYWSGKRVHYDGQGRMISASTTVSRVAHS
jgi:predicted dehydrogenase